MSLICRKLWISSIIFSISAVMFVSLSLCRLNLHVKNNVSLIYIISSFSNNLRFLSRTIYIIGVLIIIIISQYDHDWNPSIYLRRASVHSYAYMQNGAKNNLYVFVYKELAAGRASTRESPTSWLASQTHVQLCMSIFLVLMGLRKQDRSLKHTTYSYMQLYIRQIDLAGYVRTRVLHTILHMFLLNSY